MKLSGRQLLRLDPNIRDQNRQQGHDYKNYCEAEAQFVQHNHAVESAALDRPRVP